MLPLFHLFCLVSLSNPHQNPSPVGRWTATAFDELLLEKVKTLYKHASANSRSSAMSRGNAVTIYEDFVIDLDPDDKTTQRAMIKILEETMERKPSNWRRCKRPPNITQRRRSIRQEASAAGPSGSRTVSSSSDSANATTSPALGDPSVQVLTAPSDAREVNDPVSATAQPISTVSSTEETTMTYQPGSTLPGLVERVAPPSVRTTISTDALPRGQLPPPETENHWTIIEGVYEDMQGDVGSAMRENFENEVDNDDMDADEDEVLNDDDGDGDGEDHDMVEYEDAENEEGFEDPVDHENDEPDLATAAALAPVIETISERILSDFRTPNGIIDGEDSASDSDADSDTDSVALHSAEIVTPPRLTDRWSMSVLETWVRSRELEIIVQEYEDEDDSFESLESYLKIATVYGPLQQSYADDALRPRTHSDLQDIRLYQQTETSRLSRAKRLFTNLQYGLQPFSLLDDIDLDTFLAWAYASISDDIAVGVDHTMKWHLSREVGENDAQPFYDAIIRVATSHQPLVTEFTPTVTLKTALGAWQRSWLPEHSIALEILDTSRGPQITDLKYILQHRNDPWMLERSGTWTVNDSGNIVGPRMGPTEASHPTPDYLVEAWTFLYPDETCPHMLWFEDLLDICTLREDARLVTLLESECFYLTDDPLCPTPDIAAWPSVASGSGADSAWESRGTSTGRNMHEFSAIKEMWRATQVEPDRLERQLRIVLRGKWNDYKRLMDIKHLLLRDFTIRRGEGLETSRRRADGNSGRTETVQAPSSDNSRFPEHVSATSAQSEVQREIPEGRRIGVANLNRQLSNSDNQDEQAELRPPTTSESLPVLTDERLPGGGESLFDTFTRSSRQRFRANTDTDSSDGSNHRSGRGTGVSDSTSSPGPLSTSASSSVSTPVPLVTLDKVDDKDNGSSMTIVPLSSHDALSNIIGNGLDEDCHESRTTLTSAEIATRAFRARRLTEEYRSATESRSSLEGELHPMRRRLEQQFPGIGPSAAGELESGRQDDSTVNQGVMSIDYGRGLIDI